MCGGASVLLFAILLVFHFGLLSGAQIRIGLLRSGGGAISLALRRPLSQSSLPRADSRSTSVATSRLKASALWRPVEGKFYSVPRPILLAVIAIAFPTAVPRSAFLPSRPARIFDARGPPRLLA
jgi:hypothetical protein